VAAGGELGIEAVEPREELVGGREPVGQRRRARDERCHAAARGGEQGLQVDRRAAGEQVAERRGVGGGGAAGGGGGGERELDGLEGGAGAGADRGVCVEQRARRRGAAVDRGEAGERGRAAIGG